MEKTNIVLALMDIAKNETGFTWKNYSPVSYETGYQYSITPNSSANNTSDVSAAAAMVEQLNGTCGVWFYNGRWYVETSLYSKDLQTALKEAKAAEQLTIYDWKNDDYINVQ